MKCETFTNTIKNNKNLLVNESIQKASKTQTNMY
jgi:hypothetical protein